jgi:peptide/nickel transport system permease protein
MDVWRRFRRNKLAMVGLVVVLLVVLSAVFADVIAPYSPSEQTANRLALPNWEHLCGTDNLGRDLFSRILFGGRTSLLVALLGLIISLVIGTLLGSTAGYFGGPYESAVMRVMDTLMSIPALLLAVSISAMLGTGIANTAIAIAISGIPPTARLTRATVLTIRGQEYVEAAQARGNTHLGVILKHILPNTLSPLIVDCTLRVCGNIMQISSLSFIGLGVQAPTPEWGSIMNAGRDYFIRAYPMVLFPGIMVILTMFGFNMIGDGLRDALDPKLKR